MKKIISLILAIAIVLSLAVIVSAAQTTIYLTGETIDTNNFKVLVEIKENTGFAAFDFTVEFDKYVLTPVSAKMTNLGEGFTFVNNIKKLDENTKVSLAKFGGYTVDGDMTEDGAIVEIVFTFKDKIPADKQNKETEIKIISENMQFTSNELKGLSMSIGSSYTVVAPTTEREPEPGEYDEPETVKPEKEENKDVSSIVESMTGGKTEKEYKAEVKNVEEQNKVKYMAMYEDETFKPDAPATRYEVIEALNNLLEITSEEFAPAFSDVTDEYKETVQKFVTAKILNGYEDKTFKGENTITRAEFVKILAVAFDMKLDETATADFTDISGHWAESYIKTFVSGGYTKGYAEADGTFTFRPEGDVTRAEVVAFINRIIAADAEASEKLPTDLENADGSQHWAYDEIVKAVK